MQEPSRARGRLLSLDVFRGATVAAMVLVNNPGDWDHVYWPLDHAPWDGWTPTDLIFPFFLFIVGVAITMSRKSGTTSSIVRRSATLVGLGLMMSGFPYYRVSVMRFPGVLQRIGVCYLAAALVYRRVARDARGASSDRAVMRTLAVISAVLLVGYWLVLLTVPGGNGTRFDLSPDGNLGAVIDRAVFGHHTWRKTWDPEGLLSTIPSIATTLLGAMAGVWLRVARDTPARVLRGLVYGGLAAALAGSLWSLQFPLIKNLWTSSYALFCAGLASLTLAGCYWVLDVRQWRWWARPFDVLGVNAITLFVVSGLVTRLTMVLTIDGPGGRPVAWRTWVYRTFFEPLASPVNASLLYAVANLLILYGLLWWMYRRNIVVKV